MATQPLPRYTPAEGCYFVRLGTVPVTREGKRISVRPGEDLPEAFDWSDGARAAELAAGRLAFRFSHPDVRNARQEVRALEKRKAELELEIAGLTENRDEAQASAGRMLALARNLTDTIRAFEAGPAEPEDEEPENGADGEEAAGEGPEDGDGAEADK